MAKISDKISKAIQSQIRMEGEASSSYLAMAYWCDDQGIQGCKQFFLRQSEEERMHMLKFYEYLSEANVKPLTPLIEQPNQSFDSVKDLFEKVLDQEKAVTKSINEIVKLADQDKDYTTFEFLQWFVMEQREEEATIEGVLDKIKIIGDGPQSLYYIDKEIETLNQTIVSAGN